MVFNAAHFASRRSRISNAFYSFNSKRKHLPFHKHTNIYQPTPNLKIYDQPDVIAHSWLIVKIHFVLAFWCFINAIMTCIIYIHKFCIDSSYIICQIVRLYHIYVHTNKWCRDWAMIRLLSQPGICVKECFVTNISVEEKCMLFNEIHGHILNTVEFNGLTPTFSFVTCLWKWLSYHISSVFR